MHIPVLTCPADISIVGEDDLSFGASMGLAFPVSQYSNRGTRYFTTNAGASIDLNGDGKVFYGRLDTSGKPDVIHVLMATALFRTYGSGKSDFPNMSVHKGHRMATVTDGLSNTIMLAENVRCGVAPGVQRSGWMLGYVNHLAAGIPEFVCKHRRCIEPNVDLSLANSGDGRINSGLSMPEGTAPWANSFHAGGANIALADGSVKFLSESVDGELLFRMYTPQDSKLTNTSFRLR